MIQLLPCSNCQRTFSLREEVAHDAWLKCPNCGNQFCLGEMLDAFYSPWHIVPSPGLPGVPSPGLPGVPGPGLPEVPGPGSPDQSNARTAAGQPQALADEHLHDLDSLQAALLADDGPRTAAVKSRPNRAQGPSRWTFIQVMLGGAASIPVTLLLLWYVAGKDVVQAGPRIAVYVPWIVPEKFRAPAVPATGPRQPRRPVKPPVPGDGGIRSFDEVLPMEGQRLAQPSAASTEPAGAAAGSPASGAQPVETDTLMIELLTVVANVKKSIAGYDKPESEADLMASRPTAILDDLAKIADLLGKVPAGGGAGKLLRNDLKDIGRALSADAKLEAALRSGIRAQFSGAMPRAGTGRVYLGPVSEVVDQGELWQITAEEHQSGQIPGYNLQAEIPKSIAEQLQRDTKVFLLGQLVSGETESDAAAPEVVRMRANFLQSL